MTVETAKQTCGTPIHGDRLLSIADVASIMGTNNVTAGRIIKDTGARICIHRKVYVLESNFFSYLKKMEGSDA